MSRSPACLMTGQALSAAFAKKSRPPRPLH